MHFRVKNNWDNQVASDRSEQKRIGWTHDQPECENRFDDLREVRLEGSRRRGVTVRNASACTSRDILGTCPHTETPEMRVFRVSSRKVHIGATKNENFPVPY